MDSVSTIRINLITHAQAIRLPGHQFNSVQIDGLDESGTAVRIVLEPPALNAMVASVLLEKAAFGLDDTWSIVTLGRTTLRKDAKYRRRSWPPF